MVCRTLVLSVALTVISGCGAEPGPDPQLGGVDPTGPSGTAEPTPAEPEPAAFVEPAIPADGDPALHYLSSDAVLALSAPYVRNHTFAHVGAIIEPVVPPSPTATVWDFNKKDRLTTQYLYKSRPAKAEELMPGMLVAALWKRDGKSMLAPPTTTTEAYQGLWAIARVVSVRSRDEGYVLLAGGLQAPLTTVRVLDGDDSPKIAKQGTEDKHFLADEHMFVGKAALPEKRHMLVNVGLPAKPDAPLGDGGKGRFIHTSDGGIVMTAHAWRTRLATAKDLKAGVHVFAPHLKTGSVHRPPTTRHEALDALWMVVKISNPKGKTKGTVLVDGDLEVELAALRVAVE